MSGSFPEPDWPSNPDRLGSVTVALEQADRQRLDDVKKLYKDTVSAIETISKAFDGFAARSDDLLNQRKQVVMPWTKQGYTAESEASTGVIPTPGVPSPSASTPGGPSGPSPTAVRPGDPGPSASVAPVQQQSFWDRMGFAGPNVNQYERGQLRLGSFPGEAGLPQALMMASFVAGTAGWKRLPEEEVRGMKPGELADWLTTDKSDRFFQDNKSVGLSDFFDDEGNLTVQQDDAGNWYMPRGSGASRNLSSMLGASGQVAIRAPQIIKQVLGMAGRVGAMGGLNTAIAGSQAGYSTSGWFGTPFMSPAFEHSWGMRKQAALESWFGANPNYSTAQAMQAQNVINASGYHGDDASMLAHMMQSMYQSNRFMSPDLVMQLMDPLLRTGGGNPQDLKDALGDLTDAARNAHIGLQQFTQDLVSAATQVSSDTGMNIATAVTSLKTMATVTRITPSALTPMLSKQNLLMGGAITGLHISDIAEGRGTARAAFALPSRMMTIMMGGLNFAQYRQLQKTNPEMAKNIYDRVYRAYFQNPQIFGGMNPRQVLNYMAHEHAGNAAGLSDRAALTRPGVAPELNMADRTQAMMDIGYNHALTVSGMTHDIREFGGTGSRQVYRDFMADLAKHGGKLDKSDYNTIKRDLLTDMTRFAGKASDKAARQVTIALEPQYARKLFKLLGASSDPSTSNQHESFGHKALGVGEKTLHIVEDTGRIVGDVMKYIP